MKVNDLLSPTPAPSQVEGVKFPMWSGKPIVHADHAPDLDRAAGVYELGADKMPRAAAEDRAHADYKKRQHVEAAAHHLAGMKGAVATGDMEAARKHGVMYELHSKALGHDTVGPAHPDVAKKLFNNPAGFHRFKAHRGDLFAVPEKKAEEPVTKAEVLHGLYKALKQVTTWTETRPDGSKTETTETTHKGEPDPHGEHYQLHHTDSDGNKRVHPGRFKTHGIAKGHASDYARWHGGKVDVVDIRSDKTLSTHTSKHPPTRFPIKNKPIAKAESGAKCKDCGTKVGAHNADLSSKHIRCESCVDAYQSREDGVCNAVGPQGPCGMKLTNKPCRHGADYDKKPSAPKLPKWAKSEADHLNDWAKSELAAKKTPTKVVPCVCKAMDFPHRTGGGKCRAGR